MATNEESGHYKLVVAGIHELPVNTFIYDSARNHWKDSSPVPTLPVVESGEWICCGKSVRAQGSLYWFAHEIDDGSVVRALVKFDLQREEWTIANEAEAISDEVDGVHIAALDEKVVLLDWENYSPLVDLLQLGPEIKLMDGRLKDFDKMLDDCYPVWSIGQGQVLYVVFEDFWLKDSLKVLVYDQSKGTTTWLPIREWPPGLGSHKSLWAFTPSFRAFA
ncbi:hypothetical protein R1flu_015942 [Riccia fluitans]|uniref:F-box/kelch-repeat protein n=1 Tax=Riccia fluitans TaxID=41844 RepID=A0ABD1YKE5_9MARC